MEDDFTRQVDEVDSMHSIYQNEWAVEDGVNRSYSIQIQDSVTLYLCLPVNYPSESPPTYQLSGPQLDYTVKQEICCLLDEIYLDNIGETVLFQWIEAIRNYLNDRKDVFERNMASSTMEENKVSRSSESDSSSNSSNNDLIPIIHHGDVIVDRKSSFQGHAAMVQSVEDVNTVLYNLKKNKKIANATHNIYAYRIKRKDKSGITIQDCDDDGESQAGKRLLQLLQMMDVDSGVVIVSRWFGGTLLGPDRFRHINNAARQALIGLGFKSKK